jgi:hypothetical protein
MEFLSNWVTISPDELKEKETYEYEAHHSVPIKGIPWVYCVKCGLLYLNNDITRKCIRLGCLAELHPEYKKWRKMK